MMTNEPKLPDGWVLVPAQMRERKWLDYRNVDVSMYLLTPEQIAANNAAREAAEEAKLAEQETFEEQKRQAEAMTPVWLKRSKSNSVGTKREDAE